MGTTLAARGRWLATGLVIGALLAPAAAWAQQIGDRPPLLNGSVKAKHVLIATGLHSSAAAALFMCTSLEKTGGPDITLAVEWWSGTSFENDVTAGEGVVSVTPGDTVILSTHDTLHYQFENVIPNATGASRASARVMASSKKIVCAAYQLDKDNNPPTFQTPVPLFVKGKQK